MALQIDPRFPVIWRTPTSMQIGADRAIVTLEDVTVPEEHLLALLRKGISRSGFTMMANEVGAGKVCADMLLARLQPALCETTPRSAGLDNERVLVAGTGAASSAIRAVLVGLGAHTDPDSTPPALVVIVSTFDTDPREAGSWLRRDTPHLAVVFGDSEVRIGPLVEPGRGPCLHCVGRARIDLDPSWPALASQLLGKEASTEEPVIISSVVALVVRAILDRLEHAGPAIRRHRLRTKALIIDGKTGEISERRFRPHPDCACRGVPPEEISTEVSAGSGPSPTRNTTVRDARVPG